MQTRILRTAIIVAFLVGLLGIQPWLTVNAASPAEPTPPAKGLRYGYNTVTGKVSFIGGDHSTPLKAHSGVVSAQSTKDESKAVLSQFAPAFGIQKPDTDLRLVQGRSAITGHTLRYQQQYNGIPVLGGELLVNSDVNGNVLSLNGEVSPDLALANVTPAITAEQATQIALESMPGWYKLQDISSKADEPALWIYDARLLKPGDAEPELVWRMNIEATGGWHAINELVLVDAITGKIALHFNQAVDAEGLGQPSTNEVPLPSQSSVPMVNPASSYPQLSSQNAVPYVSTYTANHTTTLPGTFLCDQSAVTCTASDSDANLAQAYGVGIWNFYWNHFGRNSIDDLGMTIKSSVHYYNGGSGNAFWNGSQIAYTDGFLADDVSGHEMTHGVTQYEANLFYYYQSGAINESFSDIFGEWFDQTNSMGTDTAGVKWLLGEDISGGAIRSLSDPTAYGDPDRMTSSNYYLSWEDNGGVHTNSGVGNKAAYLMVDGGSFNGFTINGIGWEKVGAVYYYALANLLTSGSDYNDLYNALYQSCLAQVGGAKSITSADCAQVLLAIKAAEMNQSPTPTYNPDISTCPSGTTKDPSDLFFDDFENGSSKWTTTTNTGNNRWGITPGSSTLVYATSGTHAMYGNAYDSYASSTNQTSDSSVEMASAINIPANPVTYLTFRHAFEHEYGVDSYGNYYNFDGAVLEYSVNGGDWWDASNLYDSGQNYNGSIVDWGYTGNNPLIGRRAFVQESHGYVSTRYNLTNLGGKNVRFRWRMGTDYNTGWLGWVVDDVHIYSCVPNAGIVDDGDPAWNYGWFWKPEYDDTGVNTYGLFYASMHRTNTVSNADIKIKGSKFQLLYPVFSTSGKMDIYIDDVFIATIDQTIGMDMGGGKKRAIWESPDLTDDFHNLSFRPTLAGSGYIYIDAIHIGPMLTTGTYDDTNPDLMYGYSWVEKEGVAESNGTRHQTNTGDDKVTFLFYGTRAGLLYSGYPAYRGNLKITIDNIDVDTLDEYASSYQLGSLWMSGYLKSTYHILTAKFIYGQSSDKYGVIDGIVIDSNPAPDPVGAGMYDDLNSHIIYQGPWVPSSSVTGYYQSSRHQTEKEGAVMRFPFTGTQVQLQYASSPAGGLADLYIDNTLITRLNQYSAASELGKTWGSSLLSSGTHTLELRYVSGQPAGATVSVDALIVPDTTPMSAGMHEDTDLAMTYIGNWTARSGTGDRSGTRHDTNDPAGASVVIPFHGTHISILYASYPGYRGNADIYIDGVKQTVLNQYALFLLYQTPWTSDYLALGNHVLRVNFLPGQDPDKYFHIDAVAVSTADPLTTVGPGTYDDMYDTSDPLNNPYIDYIGSWAYFPQATGHYNNTRHETAVNDAKVRFPFHGTQVSLVYSGYPTRGKGDIYIDNQYVATLDQKTATWQVGLHWNSPVLSIGDHVLEFRYVNGQPVGANIVLDEFIVKDSSTVTYLLPGIHDDTDIGIDYSGNWTARTGTGDRNGTRHDTNDPAGASAVIPFHGTHISILYASYPGYRGNADIYIDSVKQTVLNQYALFLLYQTPWTSDYLTLGDHILQVNFLPGQDPDKYFHIDAVAVSDSAPLSAVGAGTYDDMYDTSDPLNNPYIDYIGSWAYFPQATGHYNNTRHETAVNDARVRFKFHGTQVSLVYSGYPTRGKGDIYIDNQYVTTLDQKTSTWQVGLKWDSAVLSSGDHALEFRYVNGQPVGANIILDEFIVQ
jgi:bacillolysin